MQLSFRLLNTLLFLGSIVGISFALYLEHVLGLEPCPLCVFQRVGLIAMGIIALIALIHNPQKNAVKRSYGILSLLGIAWSTAVAARHVWLQNLPPDQVPACGPGLDYLVEALPFKSVLQQVLTGSGECATIDWTFLGQSLPFWSFIFFSVLLLINLFVLFKKYP